MVMVPQVVKYEDPRGPLPQATAGDTVSPLRAVYNSSASSPIDGVASLRTPWPPPIDRYWASRRFG